MRYDADNMDSASSSGSSTPRLHKRRNAMADIFKGYSITDLEGVYNSTEDISRVLAPATSSCKDSDAAKSSSNEVPELPLQESQQHIRKRRNAICFDSISRLLAAGALSQDGANSDSCDP